MTSFIPKIWPFLTYVTYFVPYKKTSVDASSSRMRSELKKKKPPALLFLDHGSGTVEVNLKCWRVVVDRD